MASRPEEESVVQIAPLDIAKDLDELRAVIQSSFQTVADDFGITRENAPTNPAFITRQNLLDSIQSGLQFFCASESGRIIGCIAIQNSGGNSLFYLERVAVVPELRHRGVGAQLVDYALRKVAEAGGCRVSIGIINENRRIKEWYTSLGFLESSIKKFDHLPFTVCFMERGINI